MVSQLQLSFLPFVRSSLSLLTRSFGILSCLIFTAAPVLPVSAPPLILTLLSHTITHVLQPLFLQSSPPPPKSAPPPSRSSSTASSSRFTEILPEVSLTPLELESRKESKNSLEITLARVLNLAVVRPVTEVGKLVRDGGVVRSVIKMAVALGWEEAAEAEEKRDDLQKLVLRVLDSFVHLPSRSPRRVKLNPRLSFCSFRPTQTLGLLSPLLSSTVFPTHVSKAAGSLMTRALLRPGGVEGVLQGVFGGSEGAAETGREESDVGQKSLSVARVLGTVPGGMDAEVSWFPRSKSSTRRQRLLFFLLVFLFLRSTTLSSSLDLSHF